MAKIYAFTVALFVATFGIAQTFTDESSELTGFLNSGGCVGVCDMDQDGLDDIMVLHESREIHVYYQQGNGSFVEYNYGSVSNGNQWGSCVGDVNNDGHNDVFSGGNYDGAHLMMITAPGVSELLEMDNGIMYMQGCSMGDADADGWLDVFGCHDHALSRMWGNDGAGNLAFTEDLIDLDNYDWDDYPDTSHRGNYGSTFTDIDRDGDLDMFIAKCHQGNNDPFDVTRKNQLWINNGDGTWSEEGEVRGLVLFEQSWTADFQDLDNDGDFDALITNHSNVMQILENDGNGYFLDVTESTGLDVEGFFLQSKMVDFDNDGFIDMLVSGGLERYYKNNGDMSFTEIDNIFPYNKTMHSFGIGDLNNDGFLDLYASYGDTYVSANMANDDILWMNDTNDNNWIAFTLEGTESNKNAIGAVVEINGAFGTMVREVRAGESYGITNSFKCNFGLGTFDSVDEVTVYWPSGMETTITDPDVNGYTFILEAPCSIPTVELTPSADPTFCDGESITISAPMGYEEYVWNNGSESQMITVDSPGIFSCVVYNNEGCAGTSNSIVVEVIVPQTPTVEADGELTFCEGSDVALISSEGTSYMWSDGSETQAISVTESGEYSVDVVDQCASALSSEVITVVVLATPDTPVVDDISVDVPGTVTFTGNTETLQWFETEMSEDELGVGMEFTTPFISTTTSYWVEDVTLHGGEQANGGLQTNGEGQYHENNYNWLIFDAYEDIELLSVRVFAEGEFEREFAVFDSNNNMFESLTVNVPDGESVVELNFFIPEGTDYSLECLTDEPYLWRDENEDADLAYPFDLGEIASITSSSVGGGNWNNYYYFFYDWLVQTASTECSSDRIEVIATVVSVEDIEVLNSLSVYPNPTSDILNVNFSLLQATLVQIDIVNQLGQRIISEQLVGNSAQNAVEFDLSGLARGLYHIEFSVDGQMATQKIVVE
jgi:hypothetical protein